MLIAVIAGATAINHQEVIPLFDRQHRVVPDAAMVINALPAVGDEGADQARYRCIAKWRDHDQKGVPSSGMNAWLPSGCLSSMHTVSGMSCASARKMLMMAWSSGVAVSTVASLWKRMVEPLLIMK